VVRRVIPDERAEKVAEERGEERVRLVTDERDAVAVREPQPGDARLEFRRQPDPELESQRRGDLLGEERAQ
jgi:hypothetical protein